MKKKIIEAFKEPIRRQGDIVNLLIGGTLTFFPILNFISLGYLGTKLKNSIEQKKSMVKWDENIKNLFVKGAILSLIGLVYGIAPLLLMFLSGRLMLTLSGGKIFSLFYFRGQVLNIISTLSLLIALYFLPFGICIYLEENELKEAFKLGKIFEKILKVAKDYTLGYMAIIGLLAISILIIFLLMNWVVGLLLSGFILFYDGLVISGILSKTFPRKSITISLLEISE